LAQKNPAGLALRGLVLTDPDRFKSDDRFIQSIKVCASISAFFTVTASRLHIDQHTDCIGTVFAFSPIGKV
jgi:hypothetical protein